MCDRVVIVSFMVDTIIATFMDMIFMDNHRMIFFSDKTKVHKKYDSMILVRVIVSCVCVL